MREICVGGRALHQNPSRTCQSTFIREMSCNFLREGLILICGPGSLEGFSALRLCMLVTL